MLSALIGVVMVAAFDWNARSMVLGTATGIVVWGAVKFFPEVVWQVPRGSLPLPPEGARVAVTQSGLASRAGRTLMTIAICVALAWLADRWDLGAFFAPGQFVGYMCAYALGALLIARWERERGQRVLLDLDDGGDEYTLYAADLGWRTGGNLRENVWRSLARSRRGE